MHGRLKPVTTWLFAMALLTGLAPAQSASLNLVQTIPLAVNGRIDHLAIDARGQRLFIAALGNHSLEVVDLAGGKVSRSLGALGKPQGAAHSATLNRLFVSDGTRGVVQAFDGTTFAELARSEGLPDADNLRYNPADERLYVGYGDGAIRILDAKTTTTLADIKLPGHPEAFAVARKDKRVFANVPDGKLIAVVDSEKREAVQTWSTEKIGGNFPMALDERDRRLYVGTRKPASLLVYDLDSGKRIAALPIGGDIDDLFLDEEAGRLYAICGEGQVDVIRKVDPNQYRHEGRIATRPGARTGLYSPELKRLFVAVPRHFRDAAELRVYEVHAE
jgi:DNA-binding beta-propeller fold protein YncE